MQKFAGKVALATGRALQQQGCEMNRKEHGCDEQARAAQIHSRSRCIGR